MVKGHAGGSAVARGQTLQRYCVERRRRRRSKSAACRTAGSAQTNASPPARPRSANHVWAGLARDGEDGEHGHGPQAVERRLVAEGNVPRVPSRSPRAPHDPFDSLAALTCGCPSRFVNHRPVVGR